MRAGTESNTRFSPSSYQAGGGRWLRPLLAPVADASSAKGGPSREADGVGACLGLILNIKPFLVHTFFAYFKPPDPWQKKGGWKCDPGLSGLELNSFSLNLAPIPFFIQIYIPTREYIPTIHSVHVTIQMVLASQ